LLYLPGSSTINPPLCYSELTFVTNMSCAGVCSHVTTSAKRYASAPNDQSPCSVSFSFTHSSEVHFFTLQIT